MIANGGNRGSYDEYIYAVGTNSLVIEHNLRNLRGEEEKTIYQQCRKLKILRRQDSMETFCKKSRKTERKQKEGEKKSEVSVS